MFIVVVFELLLISVVKLNSSAPISAVAIGTWQSKSCTLLKWAVPAFIAEELEIKPSILKKAIKLAHKAEFGKTKQDHEILETILETVGKTL